MRRRPAGFRLGQRETPKRRQAEAALRERVIDLL
eukprot:COSAG03_NODE_2157_length_3067_cov_34.012803_2_plen_34_part_00